MADRAASIDVFWSLRSPCSHFGIAGPQDEAVARFEAIREVGLEFVRVAPTVCLQEGAFEGARESGYSGTRAAAAVRIA